ncbi:MAG: glycosyltransferase family 2 protein, partial [Bdellovibrionaceae bacterium]|nr:glycosyltransferase family 2 protein [Pseudobdellovibrionaceae bacterium]
SFSTDRTENICLEYARKVPLKFIKNEFRGHIDQKNFALSQCSYDFVLSIDADEALTKELQDSILSAKGLGFPAKCYKVNRLTRYVDHWVRHCGWYPDTKVRLVDRRLARWEGVNPHDTLKPRGDLTPALLNGDLLHYSYDSIEDHIQQTNRFTTIAARAAFERGQRATLWQVFTRGFFKFIRDYILKRGFLDGRYGFIICFINGLAAMLKYAKLYELQRQDNHSKKA